MAKISLVNGFTNLELGPAQTLLIKKVRYDEKYQTCNVTVADDKGRTLTEKFFFLTSDKKPNEGALGSFSALCKCATHDFKNRDIDPDEIVGLYVVADVYEQIVKNQEGEEIARYTHLRNYREADLATDEVEEDDEDLWD